MGELATAMWTGLPYARPFAKMATRQRYHELKAGDEAYLRDVSRALDRLVLGRANATGSGARIV